MTSAADIQALPTRLRGCAGSWRTYSKCHDWMRRRAPRQSSSFGQLRTSRQRAPRRTTAARVGSAASGISTASGTTRRGSPTCSRRPATATGCCQPAGVVPGSWPPPPPPPPPLPWTTAPTSTFTPTVWGNEATPHRIVFSSPQQLGAAVAGYGGGLAAGRYGSWSSAAWQGAPMSVRS